MLDKKPEVVCPGTAVGSVAQQWTQEVPSKLFQAALGDSGSRLHLKIKQVGKNDRMISVRLQDKPFNITVIQVYAPTSNADETEIERFYEDLQDLLELTPKKDVLFIVGDWNAKVGSQETPGITGKFGLRMQNEVGKD